MMDMKKLKLQMRALFTSFLALALLGACSPSESSSSSDSSSGSSENIDSLPTDINDGMILHCFDWTFAQIEENLDTIASLGYRAVQTSPVTQPKSKGSIWYYFYQPVSYSIATSSPLGGKEELTSLCTAAEERGISVIVDVVFNHMATTGGTNSDGTPDIDPEVNEYEPYIYENREELFHHSLDTSTITQAYDGLPDLNTAHPYIQERSLSLLKECIDCGVDGFRFDAAKHIETPDDEEYASDFWTNTLGEAKKYYEEKTGGTLYAYGEILGSPGNGRSISNYTKLMKVTNDSYIDLVSKTLVVNKSASVSAMCNTSYDADLSITWVESHDTVLHDETNWTYDQLVVLWAYMAARKDTQSLFFARTDTDDNSCTVGTIGNYDWNSIYFGAANKFHNRFVGAEENRFGVSDLYVDERYSDSDAGALIIDVKDKGSGSVTFENLPDGTYYDQITGNEVIISGGSASLTFDSSNRCVIFLTKDKPVIPDTPEVEPTLTVSRESSEYVDEFTLNLTLENASDATISVNEGEAIHWNDTYSLVIGDDEDVADVSIWYTDGTDEYTEEYLYTRASLVEGYFNIINLDSSLLSSYEIYVWSWVGTSSTWGKPYTYDEGTGYLLIPDETVTAYTGFLLAIFEKGHEITNLTSWDSACLKQTSDISPTAGYFDALSFHL